ncbi:heterokaryon incompatibility protein-domain-containing protein [Xylariaceae sp. FL1651]|nr:heterokaryon incompatibility protein-domain-containing protein [Xylariaceae sp. FL1651]
MWLINARTLELELKVEPETNSYAILSHVWEEEEAWKKKGFKKIRQTCRFALERDLKYAWVETCCIDKSSSAELSEAINFMFRWYQESGFCVAFLSDLPPSSEPNRDFPLQFPQCRWLTRGFTLQELIAPYLVEFYDAQWNYRGGRRSWKSLISESTGIDEAILEDSEGPFNVSWASKRNTTRLEDQAYCLLGIFQVNMPMIYGEGARAFPRLQEEIAKQSCDLSLFAWQQDGPYPLYRGVLARSPSEFAKCHNLKHKVRDNTTLVNFPDVSKDIVWNLGCSDRDDWSKMDISGYFGVFLAQTAARYVRVNPHRLFQAGYQYREKNKAGTIYIKSHVSPLECARFLRRALFLSQAQGINAYVLLKFHPTFGLGPQSSIIVACSTMGQPVCTIWDKSNTQWYYVEKFIGSTRLVSDFVAADYLRLHFLSRAPTSPKTDVRIRASVAVHADLREFVFEGQHGFLLNIEASVVSKHPASKPGKTYWTAPYVS